MPQRTATVGSPPEVFGMVEAMRAGGPDWCAGPRPGSFGAGWRRMSTAATEPTGAASPAKASKWSARTAATASRRPAPPSVPVIPARRRRARGIGNVPNQLPKPDREDAERPLHDIMDAPNPTAARRRIPLRRP